DIVTRFFIFYQMIISEFGLSGPADKQNLDNKIHGSSGSLPFYNRKHNLNLALDLCNGLRPEFGKETPEFYKKLAYRNANPNQRPTTEKMSGYVQKA
ncbi:17432_t:CDS:2, partial [Funneliformis geosporum]